MGVHGELSSLLGTTMNGFVVLAAAVCATSAQVAVVPGYAGAYNPAPSTQFHAQDEFGQFSFGHAGGPLARTEARNAYGVTTGSYQYVDANGLLQTVNYVADPVNGFQVAGTNLPVGPAAPEVAPLVAPTFNPEPLVAPVFDGVAPEPVQDTPEVAEAKAAHLAAVAAAGDRKRRDADEEAAPAVAALPLGLPYAGLPLTYAAAAPVAAGLPLTYAAAALPAAAAVAHAPVVKSVVEKPAEVATEIAAHPVISYAAPFAAPFYGKRSADEEAAAPAPAALPLGLPYAGLPLTYAGYPYAAGLPVAAPVATPLAAAAPVATPLAVAAAAPSREAVLTTIKLNPGHAVAYRVD